ncbi:MAG: KH domain-containing protein [Bacilli bacterium]|nr:KH domain-containing protein [Bacilli bacterium]
MRLAELTTFLIKSVVKNPESVSVKGFETEEGIVIEVLVSEEDMGAVIGRGGQIATAIRILVRASAYINEEPRVKINIDSI